MDDERRPPESTGSAPFLMPVGRVTYRAAFYDSLLARWSYRGVIANKGREVWCCEHVHSSIGSAKACARKELATRA